MSHVPITLTSKFNVKLMWHQCGINFLLTGKCRESVFHFILLYRNKYSTKLQVDKA